MSIVLQEVRQPTEGIKLETPNVQAFFKDNSLGNGTLYITHTNVTWISGAPGSKGFSVSYPAIVLHAISTDVSVFPSEHIFVMVDQRKSDKRRRRAPVLRTIQEDEEQKGLEIAAAELEEEESNDGDEAPGLEIRFVPDNKDVLSEIYHEILVGQEENPEEDDPMFDDEEEEEEAEEGMDEGLGDAPAGQWFTAENVDDVQLSEEGLANLQRMMGGGRGGDQHQNDEQME